jgi:hypothetical protein
MTSSQEEQVNATRVIHAKAVWQAGPSLFQADAEVRKNISVLIDTLIEYLPEILEFARWLSTFT